MLLCDRMFVSARGEIWRHGYFKSIIFVFVTWLWVSATNMYKFQNLNYYCESFLLAWCVKKLCLLSTVWNDIIIVDIQLDHQSNTFMSYRNYIKSQLLMGVNNTRMYFCTPHFNDLEIILTRWIQYFKLWIEWYLNLQIFGNHILLPWFLDIYNYIDLSLIKFSCIVDIHFAVINRWV